jgi:hypothetical protein
MEMVKKADKLWFIQHRAAAIWDGKIEMLRIKLYLEHYDSDKNPSDYL